MVERRVVQDRLVLSCERGLIEIELRDLPRVHERSQLPFLPVKAPSDDAEFDDPDEEEHSSPAVLGRLGSEAFVLTRGRPQPWGLLDIEPAELFMATSGELTDIKNWLGPAPPDEQT
jgi:hypothetical protein